MRLRYTPAAAYDLQQIEAYIRDTLKNPDAATDMLLRVMNDIALLKEQPFLGPELSAKLGRELEGRYLVTGRYLAVYEVGEAVSVLRVLDTRMDYMKAAFADREPTPTPPAAPDRP